MRFPQLPEDFLVEELSDVTPQPGGFALYRLRKRDLGTLEALAEIARAWHVDRRRLSVGGLKDRWAVTRQFLTIEGGPRERLRLERLEVEYLGSLDRAFTSAEIRGNRFTLVLRDLSATELALCRAGLAELAQSALPNYFDEQRFGSRGASGEFIAAAWCRGDWERAVWLALADDYRRDSAEARRIRARLRAAWGDWRRSAAWGVDEPSRRALAHLARRPGDFRGALVCWPSEVRSLWLAAYQSWLWNSLAQAWLRSWLGSLPLERSIAGRGFGFPGPLTPAERERGLETPLPLPSARAGIEGTPWGEFYARVLAEEHQTSLAQLAIPFPRENFFSRGERCVLVMPEGLTVDEAPDELWPGQTRLTLGFALPRAAYATILVKRLASGARGAIEPPRE